MSDSSKPTPEPTPENLLEVDTSFHFSFEPTPEDLLEGDDGSGTQPIVLMNTETPPRSPVMFDGKPLPQFEPEKEYPVTVYKLGEKPQ